MNTPSSWQTSAAAIALVTAALLWFVGGHRWPRVIVVLVIGGFGGLVDTAFGRAIHSGAAVVLNEIDKLTAPLIGSAIAWVIVVVLFGIVVFHVVKQEIGEWTLGFSAGFSLTAAFVPGIGGQALIGLIAACTNIIGLLSYWPFHGHF